MTELHLVVPAGIDDPARPSGGNVYDRRAGRRLADLGWGVREHRMSGPWPAPAPGDQAALAAVLAGLPDGALVLIDGLIGSAVPEVLRAQAGRLRPVVLLHMPLDGPGERAALAAASAVVATSRWTRDWVTEHHALPSDRVHVVAPGVDPAPWAPGTPSGGHLLSVGAVTPLKGQDVLLDALAGIGDLPWRGRCVGALDVDATFVARMLRRRDVAGLGDRVSFTGALVEADLDDAYAWADVLVLTSRTETYGMVVTEALARGLPVVAADGGGVPEALGRAADGNLPGMLVPPSDPRALALALRGWLRDPGTRDRLREAARSRSGSLTGWAEASRSLSDVLTEVASAAISSGISLV